MLITKYEDINWFAEIEGVCVEIAVQVLQRYAEAYGKNTVLYAEMGDYVQTSLKVIREETEEERSHRNQEETTRAIEKEASERKLYDLLKSKYENSCKPEK